MVRAGRIDAVKSLLKAGAPVDKVGQDGMTPLFLAVGSHEPAATSIVELLLAHEGSRALLMTASLKTVTGQNLTSLSLSNAPLARHATAALPDGEVGRRVDGAPERRSSEYARVHGVERT